MKKRCHIVINIELCIIIIVLIVLQIRCDRRTAIPSSELNVKKSGGLYSSKMIHKYILELRQTDRVRVGVKRFERMGN